MATQPLRPARSIKTTHGGAQEYDKLAPTSGQSWINGDLLVKVDGALTLCGADPVAISYISQIDESDVVPGETKCVVQRIKPSEQYVMSAFHTTAANATVPDTALDANSTYGVTLQTVSGVAAWCLDLQDTTNVKVKLLERLDLAADLYPQCVVQFLSTAVTFA